MFQPTCLGVLGWGWNVSGRIAGLAIASLSVASIPRLINPDRAGDLKLMWILELTQSSEALAALAVKQVVEA